MPTTRFWPEITTGRCLDRSLCSAGMTTTNDLLLIANAGDGTISALRLHREPDPHLEVLATSADLPGCSTFAIDPDHDHVYAAFKGDPPGIATLTLDRETGILTEIARTPVEGSLSYLALTPDGRSLLGVSYGGDFGAVWPVEGGSSGSPGSLGTAHSRFEHRNLHSVLVHHLSVDGADADADAIDTLRVYAASLGDDLIAQFAMASDASGTLTPLDPPTVPAPTGSGPDDGQGVGPGRPHRARQRQLAAGPHQVVGAARREAHRVPAEVAIVEHVGGAASVYLVTEFSGEAIRYTVDADGRLHPAESVTVTDPDAGLHHSRIGADPIAGHLIWGADIHRAGGHLITSERTSSQLAVTTLGPGGELGPVLGFTPTETTPRGFGVSPDGRFVVAVGEGSTHAQLLEVGDDGTLTPVDRVQIGVKANWVRFVT